ncbi:MAG: hypothetical protein MI806_20590 [Minwuiales bacterium]|nr:hypothetical protein [Minwuiales bacterium]
MNSRPKHRSIDTLKAEIDAHLERQRQAVEKQIRRYPPPIPACDAQFNYLLEERDRLCRETAALADAVDNATNARAAARALAVLAKRIGIPTRA